MFSSIDGKTLTFIVLGIFIVGLIIYDVYVYYFYGLDSTISRVTYNFAKENPIISFAVGVVVGHLFWGQKIEVIKEKTPLKENLELEKQIFDERK